MWLRSICLKNLAIGRHWLSWCVRIIASLWVAYLHSWRKVTNLEKTLKICEKLWNFFFVTVKTVKWLKTVNNSEKQWKTVEKSENLWKWKKKNGEKLWKCVRNGEKLWREGGRQGRREGWPLRGQETDHVISGLMRGLKNHGRWTSHTQTDGHVDSMTAWPRVRKNQ